ERSSPEIFPSLISASPIWLATLPVSLSPSTLKVKVLSNVPLGVSSDAFQVPVTSAAEAVNAKTASNTSSHFIGFPFVRVPEVGSTYFPVFLAAGQGGGPTQYEDFLTLT